MTLNDRIQVLAITSIIGLLIDDIFWNNTGFGLFFIVCLLAQVIDHIANALFLKKIIALLNQKKQNQQTIFQWQGTISSQGPKQQGPIEVLALRTELDHTEYNEGCNDAKSDFNAGKPMNGNLNYPSNPYARAYIETYRSLDGYKIRISQ